jgi:hypothetical protein
MTVVGGFGAVAFEWFTFVAYRFFALIMQTAYLPDAAEWDREDFGFWLGAWVSSFLLSQFPGRVTAATAPFNFVSHSGGSLQCCHLSCLPPSS